MSGPVLGVALAYTRGPLSTESMAMTPLLPQVSLNTFVTFPGSAGERHMARMDCTQLPQPTAPFLIGVHRASPSGVGDAAGVYLDNRRLSQHHAMVGWNGAARVLTVMDLGSGVGTNVACPAWSTPVDLRRESVSIFVGEEPRSVVTLAVGRSVFLEIVVGDAVSVDQCIYAMAEEADADGAELARLQGVIRARDQAGARSVGLALSSRLFAMEARARCYDQLADTATALGMLVIPVLQNDAQQRLQTMQLGDAVWREYGAGTRECLDEGIATCRQKLREAEESLRRNVRWFVTGGAPTGWPESAWADITQYQVWLKCLQAVQEEWASIAYDINRWNDLWESCVNVALYDMQQVVLDTRPDFVIVDAADVEPLADATGYRVAH